MSIVQYHEKHRLGLIQYTKRQGFSQFGEALGHLNSSLFVWVYTHSAHVSRVLCVFLPCVLSVNIIIVKATVPLPFVGPVIPAIVTFSLPINCLLSQCW